MGTAEPAPATPDTAWAEAQKLESRDPSAATADFARLAAAARDTDSAARALLAQSRCLLQAGVKAAALALQGAVPSGDNATKIVLAQRIAVRALTLAALGTPDRMPALPASVFEGEFHD